MNKSPETIKFQSFKLSNFSIASVGGFIVVDIINFFISLV